MAGVRAALAGEAAHRGEFERVDELVASVLASPDPRARLSALETAADAAAYRGDFEHGRQAAIELERLGDELGEVRAVAMGELDRALWDVYAGEPDAARSAASLDDTRPGLAPSENGWIAYVRGEAMAESDPDAAVRHYEAALELADSAGNRFLRGVSSVSVLALRARTGDPAAALHAFAPTVEGDQAELGRLWAEETARRAAQIDSGRSRRIPGMTLWTGSPKPVAGGDSRRTVRPAGNGRGGGGTTLGRESCHWQSDPDRRGGQGAGAQGCDSQLPLRPGVSSHRPGRAAGHLPPVRQRLIVVHHQVVLVEGTRVAERQLGAVVDPAVEHDTAVAQRAVRDEHRSAAQRFIDDLVDEHHRVQVCKSVFAELARPEDVEELRQSQEQIHRTMIADLENLQKRYGSRPDLGYRPDTIQWGLAVERSLLNFWKKIDVRPEKARPARQFRRASG